MKNLKVGMKIFVGFAVVVAMMVIMGGTVIVTTAMTRTNAKAIETSSALQTAMNETLDAFGLARIQANIIYNMNNPEANEAFGPADADVKDHISKALALAQSSPDVQQYTPDIQDFSDAYDEWSQNVNSVIALNNQLTALGEEAVANADQVYEVFKSGMETRINTEAAPPLLLNSLDAIDDITYVRQGLAHIRDTYDGSDAENIQARMDNVVALLENGVAAAAGTASQAALQSALDQCLAIKGQISEFLTLNDQGWTLVDTTRAAGVANLQKITDLTASLDNDMNGDVTATLQLGNATIIIVSVLALLSVAIAVFMGIYIARLITVPTKGVSFSLKYLAETGNLDLPPDVKALAQEIAQRKDELGETALNYGILMQRLGYIAGELDKVAEGDLTSHIEIASENDVMGLSLQKMLEKLNAMFGQINAATLQVSDGSKQMADGAQSLAQGSTEQAASVQQLSSSIASVAAQTEENASMADDAAKLAATIMQGAEKSSEQMQQMMGAVAEITDASQNINKVIKVIDDIAFQTNILALNAAVEAARAGQHGKGFAVVAEEVRNLAAKSAEAARNTSGMIANSIEKAELGARIAQDTSASLSQIVDGITQSSQIVGNIAASSNDQSTAIKEINLGIDQVAQVVQQNSATAEQSAAASEEMSGQAHMLEQLVAQFRLLDSQNALGAPAARPGLPQANYTQDDFAHNAGEPLF